MYGSICISDVPRELLKKADNGKVYLNIAVSKRREPSQFGDTHNVIASVPADKRKEGDKPLYIGNMREHVPQVVSTQDVENMPSAEDTDLPF